MEFLIFMIPFHAQILTKFTRHAQFLQNFTYHEIQNKSIEALPLSAVIKTKEPKRIVAGFVGRDEKTLKPATEITGIRDFDRFAK